MLTTKEYINIMKQFDKTFKIIPQLVDRNNFINVLDTISHCQHLDKKYVLRIVFHYLLSGYCPIDWRNLEYMIAVDEILSSVPPQLEYRLRSKKHLPLRSEHTWEQYYKYLVDELK